jgi:hypothetical protein
MMMKAPREFFTRRKLLTAIVFGTGLIVVGSVSAGALTGMIVPSVVFQPYTNYTAVNYDQPWLWTDVSQTMDVPGHTVGPLPHLPQVPQVPNCPLALVCGPPKPAAGANPIPPCVPECPSGSTSSILVMVDGAQLPLPQLRLFAATEMLRARQAGTLIDGGTAWERAAAYQVLDRLVYLQAVKDSNVVPDSVVRAFAERQLAYYNADSSPHKPKVPKGYTAADVFLAPQGLAVYKWSLTVGREKHYLTDYLAHARGPVAESIALLTWFRLQLPAHTVQINGLVPFSVADALTPGTF